MKVKSFRGYSSIPDDKINEFIVDKKVIDIKITSHAVMDRNGNSSEYHTVLVMYE